MDKFTHLTADNMTKQEPGTLVSRFVDQCDTVETLFSSGIISMSADGAKSSVFWSLSGSETAVWRSYCSFCCRSYSASRATCKKMCWQRRLKTARPSGRAWAACQKHCTTSAPFTASAKRSTLEKRYDTYINKESYRALEKTNFYDAVYFPVILITNAVVVAVVMLLSARQHHRADVVRYVPPLARLLPLSTIFRRSSRRLKALGMDDSAQSSPRSAGIHRINEFFALEETIPIPYRHMSRRPSPQEGEACRLSSFAMSRSATISALCTGSLEL